MTDLNKFILGVVICVALFFAWSLYTQKPAPVKDWTPAKEMKETKGIKRVKVKGPAEIITIDKDTVSKKIKLPDPIAKDPKKQVTATATIPPYEGETDVVSIMDTETGQNDLITKQKKLPIVQLKNQKELGVRAGTVIGKDGQRYQVDIYGRWTLIRVGKVHVGLYGEVNTNSEAKAMIDVSFRW